MNSFHVPPRLFGYLNHCSTLATSTHLDNLDLAPACLSTSVATAACRSLRTSIWTCLPSWPLFFGLLPVDYLLMLSLSRVTLCADQSRHFSTNPTICGGVPCTLLHLPGSHLNRSPRLPLVRQLILVNRESYLLHRTTSTSLAGHPMTRKRRKSGNEMMIQMMT